MTKQDHDRLAEMRREVTLLQADYDADADARNRFQAVLDGLDEALDGPEWRVNYETGRGLIGSTVVRAHTEGQARERGRAAVPGKYVTSAFKLR